MGTSSFLLTLSPSFSGGGTKYGTLPRCTSLISITAACRMLPSPFFSSLPYFFASLSRKSSQSAHSPMPYVFTKYSFFTRSSNSGTTISGSANFSARTTPLITMSASLSPVGGTMPGQSIR